MKNFNVTARVKVGFNDKTKLDENNEPQKWEEDEIIKDMPRDRFEELESLGYVEEDKTFKDTKKNKDKKEWEQ